MITVANRATPQPLSMEQQENAMTSEGAPPAGQMPGQPPAENPLTGPIIRSAQSLFPPYADQGAGRV